MFNNLACGTFINASPSGKGEGWRRERTGAAKKNAPRLREPPRARLKGSRSAPSAPGVAADNLGMRLPTALSVATHGTSGVSSDKNGRKCFYSWRFGGE